VERKERGHKYDDVAQLVAERVKNTRGRISAERLLPVARAAGYAGSARNFRRLVAEAKPAWRVIITWPTARGVAARRDVDHRLGHARRVARVLRGLGLVQVPVHPVRRQRARPDGFELLAECFEVLGGVPAVLLADRMDGLKAGWGP
jgi:hypothetical protein